MTGGTEAEGFTMEPTATGGVTLASLARDWRAEAEAIDPGKVTPDESGSSHRRFARAQALRDCAAELEALPVQPMVLTPGQFAIVKAEWDALRDDLRGFLAAGESLRSVQVAVSRDDLDLALNRLDGLAVPGMAADARARLSAAVEAGL
jgi:hypothetical protein